MRPEKLGDGGAAKIGTERFATAESSAGLAEFRSI